MKMECYSKRMEYGDLQIYMNKPNTQQLYKYIISVLNDTQQEPTKTSCIERRQFSLA